MRNTTTMIYDMKETIRLQSTGLFLLGLGFLISLSFNIAQLTDVSANSFTLVDRNIHTTIESPQYALPYTVQEIEALNASRTSILETQLTMFPVEIASVATIVEPEEVVPPIDEETPDTIEVIETVNNSIEPVISDYIAETEITSTADIDLETLRSTIETIAPSLLGIEEAMLQIYEDTGIKPSFQLAKFCLESGYGTSDLTTNKNNIGGWNAYPYGGRSSYENATTFDTLGDCVLTIGYSISENYIGEGRTTVGAVASKYCPINEVAWASSVTSLMHKIESTYESLT